MRVFLPYSFFQYLLNGFFVKVTTSIIFFTLSIPFAWCDSVGEVNIELVPSPRFQVIQTYQIDETREIFDKHFKYPFYQLNRSIRIEATHLNSPLESDSLTLETKMTPSTITQHRIEFHDPWPSPLPHTLKFIIWDAKNKYQVEKEFHIRFIEGDYWSTSEGRKFSAVLLPDQEIVFQEFMKNRFYFEVLQKAAIQKRNLRRIGLTIQSMKITNFQSEGNLRLVGDFSGILLALPNYSFDVVLTLSPNLKDGLTDLSSLLDLPDEFHRVEEISLTDE